MKLSSVISLLLAGAVITTAQESGSLPAFNPVMTANPFTLQVPTAVTYGYFRLTPSSCSGSSAVAAATSSGGRHRRRRVTSSSSTSACTGFDVSNDATFSTKVNSATVDPMTDGVVIDPMQPQTYVVATLTLTNKGLVQPTDARAILVPVTGNITFNTPLVDKPTNLLIDFKVMWTTGSPAPGNTAGIFTLVTRSPAPSSNFTVSMSSQVDFNMNMQLLGFVADPDLGKDAVVLGGEGQPKPNAGEPGPRVYVKRGTAQVVKLYGLISNTANLLG